MALDFGKIGNIQKQHEEELKLEQERKERELREAQEKIEREKYGDVPKDVFDFMLECLSDAIDYAVNPLRNYVIIKDVTPGSIEARLTADFAVESVVDFWRYHCHKIIFRKTGDKPVILFPLLFSTLSEFKVELEDSLVVLTKTKKDDEVIWEGYNIQGESCPKEVIYTQIRFYCYIFYNNKSVIQEVFERGLANKPYTLKELQKAGKIRFIE